jgi:DDE superfamily endonuclease
MNIKRPAYSRTNTKRELVTCNEYINNNGKDLPPFIILPGVQLQEKFFGEVSDDILIDMSKTGYSNDELAFESIKHFDRFSTRRQQKIYRLLLMDGYESHCTYEFLEYCETRNIIPFCFPPHSTHLMQPLDVVVFQPYKHWHQKAVNETTRTGYQKYNKVEFLASINSIRKKTFKRSTIISAWRATNLIPHNPQVILDQLREAAPEPDPPRPTTPTNHDPFLDTKKICKTIRTYRRQCEAVMSMEMPNNVRQRLYIMFGSRLIQANQAAQAYEDLS